MKNEVVKKRIEWSESDKGGPLGRNVHHDPRSAAYNIAQKVARLDMSRLSTVSHKRHTGAFNQGNLGSCTGNAAVGLVDTEPLFFKHVRYRLYEPTAIKVYSLATKLDEWDGAYPPDDTGSSGLAAAKACQQKKYIGSYYHAFSLEDAITALQTTPWMCGTYWYEGQDEPDANGMVAITGQIRGGHEYEALGYYPQHTNSYLDDIIEFINSWTAQWGIKGRFRMKVRDFGNLLQQDGDVTVMMP